MYTIVTFFDFMIFEYSCIAAPSILLFTPTLDDFITVLGAVYAFVPNRGQRKLEVDVMRVVRYDV